MAGLLLWLSGKKPACPRRRHGFHLGLGRSPGEGNGNSLQYACLGNLMDRGPWRATVQGSRNSRTPLSSSTTASTSWRSQAPTLPSSRKQQSFPSLLFLLPPAIPPCLPAFLSLMLRQILAVPLLCTRLYWQSSVDRNQRHADETCQAGSLQLQGHCST